MDYCLTPGKLFTYLIVKSSWLSTNFTLKSSKELTNSHSPHRFGEDVTTSTLRSSKLVTTLTLKSSKESTTFTFPYSGIFSQEQCSLSMGLAVPVKSRTAGMNRKNNSVFMA